MVFFILKPRLLLHFIKIFYVFKRFYLAYDVYLRLNMRFLFVSVLAYLLIVQLNRYSIVQYLHCLPQNRFIGLTKVTLYIR